MIKIENFTKSYSSKNNTFKVDKVNIEIPEGQVTALLGPNGSGKTTILKAICGIHYPDEGNITIDNIDTVTSTNQIMNCIGYVPEITILPSDMIVIEFLEYCAKLHGIEGKDFTKALEKTIKICNLSKILTKKIKTLSKGFQQRVSFAQALIHNPRNLILDEPVTGLDPAQIVQMRALITELSKTKAILMTTHLLQEVYSLCSKIYILNNGKIVSEGTEKEIIAATKTANLDEAFYKLCQDNEE